MSGGDADVVVRIAARGDGVTGDGRFVAGAAPGDRVDRDGTLIPGPHHCAPACRHFGTCGGCQLQQLDDAALAAFVTDRVTGPLAGQGIAAARVLPAHLSPPATRRRATMRALRPGKRVVLGFNADRSAQVVDLVECPLLTPELFALVEPVRALLRDLLPARGTAEVRMQAVDQGVDLTLAMPVPEGLAAAEALQDFGHRRGLARLAIDDGHGAEVRFEPEPATVTLGGVAVAVPPFAFLQPTADGEAALRAAVAEGVGGARRIADLFAGVGTFALDLSRDAGRRIYAAEAARDALSALKQAADRAQRMVVTEHRDLYRRPLIPAELDRFDAVVLDPPRAGAEAQVAQIAASRTPRVVYVSCNPATFARDARALVDAGYALDRVLPVGQFRWSTHVELVATLSRGG